MSFQAALNSIITPDELHLDNPLTEQEIVTENFTIDCAQHNVLVHKVQFGGYKVDQVVVDYQSYYQHHIHRAYVVAYMPTEIANLFINSINIEGTVIAEKVNYIRDDMYATISPSLIPHVPIRYMRRHINQETLNTLPFEIDNVYNLLVSKSDYEYLLSQHNITNYENLTMVLILDPKSGRKAHAHPGLFSEIGRAIRSI